MLNSRAALPLAIAFAVCLPRPASAFEMVPQFGHSDRVTGVAFSQDGALLASTSKDGTAKIWDVATGRILKTMFFNNEASDLWLSTDGLRFQVIVDKTDVRPAFEFATGARVSREVEEQTTFKRPIRERSLDKKRTLERDIDKRRLVLLEADQPGDLFEAKIPIPDSAHVVTYGFSLDDSQALACWEQFLDDRLEHGIVRLYRVPSGKNEGNVTLGAGALCRKFAFSRDGKLALAGMGKITILSVPGLRVISVLEGFFGGGGALTALPADLKQFTTVGAATGQEQSPFAAHNQPDGAANEKGFPRVQIINGEVYLTRGKGLERVGLSLSMPVDWHPNGLWMATGESYGRGGDNDRKMHLVDIKSGKSLASCKAGSHYLQELRFSPDGALLAGATKGERRDKGTLRVWRHGAGGFFGCDVTVFGADRVRPQPFAFTADSKRMVATGPDGKTVEILDVDKGHSIATLKGHLAEVTALAISPNGKLIASADGRVVKLWDQATGAKVRDLSSPGAPPNRVDFNPNGRILVGWLTDGSRRLWNLDTGAAVSLLARAGEWLAVDDAGHFDSSRDGARMVAMVDGLKTFGIEQFALQLNRPDLLLTALGSDDQAAIAHYRSRFEQRLRKAGVSEAALSTPHVPTARIDGVESRGRTAEVKFTATDTERDLKTYQLSVDGTPLFGPQGKKISGRTFSGTETVELPAGAHQIEVSATNVDGAESYRAQVTANGQDAGKATLWYLGFGVSRYADSALSLKWAHKDATDLGAAFAAMAGKAEYGEVKVKTFTDSEVTVEAIREAKKYFMESKPGDTLVLFVAGHGVHDRDVAATYYYLTHEAKVDDLPHTAARFELIEDLLQGTGARRKLFLMDTCESGERDEEENTLLAQSDGKALKARAVRGIKKTADKAATHASRPFLRQRDRFIYNDLSRRSGAIVLSSSRGGEFSYERDDLQHGLFTTEILAALQSTAADADHDGLVTPQELRDYVTKAVAKRSDGLQNPTVDRDNLLQHFGLPLTVPGPGGTP